MSSERSGRREIGRGTLIAECREHLGKVLPMTAQETAFLDHILDQGEVKPELLTADTAMADRIKRHPLLQWKAMNVREHKSAKKGE